MDPPIVNNQAVRQSIRDQDEILVETLERATAAASFSERAYKESEIVEHHFHTYERWWGIAVAPTTKNCVLKGVTNPFVLTSGLDTWGPAVQVVGYQDKMGRRGSVKFDLHRIVVIAQSQESTYLMRFLYSEESLEEAAQAERWSEVPLTPTIDHPLAGSASPIDTFQPQVVVGTMVWAQCWNVTNLATISFFEGAHGYP